MRFECMRYVKTHQSYGGLFFINGRFFAYSIENVDLAIPEGTFAITRYFSPKRQFNVPLLDVPQRAKIEIHPANFPEQLEGCIAIAWSAEPDAIGLDHAANSRMAFDHLMSLFNPRIDAGEACEIRVTSISLTA